MLTKLIFYFYSVSLAFTSITASGATTLSAPVVDNSAPTPTALSTQEDFEEFLQCFELTDLPLKINAESIAAIMDTYYANSLANSKSKLSQRNTANPDYTLLQQFLPIARFTRFGNKHITPLYVYAASKDVMTVLYTSQRYYSKDTPYELSAATFDDTGALLSSKNLLFNSKKNQKALSIDTRGLLYVYGNPTTYKTIKGRQTVKNKSNKTYRIDQEGQFVLSRESSLTQRKKFAEFLAQFNKAELPYTWDNDRTKNGYNRNAIVQNYLDEAFNNNRKAFSRVGPPRYSPIEYFELEDNVVAVLYKSGNFMGGNYISIAMFNADGEPISHNNKEREYTPYQLSLASSSHAHHRTFEINKAGDIKVNHYEYERDQDHNVANRDSGPQGAVGPKKFKNGTNEIVREQLKEIINYKLGRGARSKDSGYQTKRSYVSRV